MGAADGLEEFLSKYLGYPYRSGLRVRMHFPFGLSEPVTDGVCQFSRGHQKVSHSRLTVFPGVPGPFAIVVGMVVVVLYPVIQQFDEFV
jgi:hypothetical protein